MQKIPFHKTPKGKAYSKAYYAKNRARLIAQMKEYRVKNWETIKPKMVQSIKQWRINSREKYREMLARKRARDIEYRQSHPEEFYEINGRYHRYTKYQRDPELRRLVIQERQRRAREKLKRNPVALERHRTQAREGARRKSRKKKYQRIVNILTNYINVNRMNAERYMLLGG